MRHPVGEQAEKNEKWAGIFGTEKKTIFITSKTYVIPNQVSSFDQLDRVQPHHHLGKTGSDSVWSSRHEM